MTPNKDEAIAVTDENFGELLIEGLKEAIAVRHGEQDASHRHTRPILHPEDGPQE